MLTSILEVLRDLPNHNSFRYINRESLSREFFTKAEESLNDERLYIVLSNTKSASSRVISWFTKNEFNHVSLSFDNKLKSMVSYNGGNKRNKPGLNQEYLEDLIKNKDSTIYVYSLDVKRSVKERVLNRVKEINKEGSSYNILGLILKHSFKPNIMFCSQFVSSILKEAGAGFHLKRDTLIKPSDIVEEDRENYLNLHYSI